MSSANLIVIVVKIKLFFNPFSASYSHASLIVDSSLVLYFAEVLNFFNPTNINRWANLESINKPLIFERLNVNNEQRISFFIIIL